MRSRKRQLNILLLVNLSRASGRSILTNIFTFADMRPNWQIRVVQIQEFPPQEIVATIREAPPDGIISSEMEEPLVAGFLEHSTIPLVVIGTRRTCIPRRKRNLTFVALEEESVGRLGAQTLLSLGCFESYGFVHYSESDYGHMSFLRKRGFRKVMCKAGKRITSFGGPAVRPENDRAEMEAWLKGLPKPGAVMVGCDKRAVEVMDACARLKIAVPAELAVLSVDNDEFLCRSTTPTLSSLTFNIGDAGLRAAQELDRLLRKGSETPRHILIPSHSEVIERRSTRSRVTGVSVVRRALAFIAENATRDIRVPDVVRHLDMSRRLVELRFREFGGESVHEAIDRIRLDEFRRRLKAQKTASIAEVAADCGYPNASNLMTKFKARYGQTVDDFRRTCRS